MNLTSILVLVGAALALWLMTWWLKRRSTLGHWDKQLNESEQLCGQLKDFGSEYKALQKKHAELFALVDSIVNERNVIMGQYHQQASEHANAQDMMMREIKVLTTQYERLVGLVKTAPDLETAQKHVMQRPLRKNELLAQIAEDFRNEHVAPAVEQKRA